MGRAQEKIKDRKVRGSTKVQSERYGLTHPQWDRFNGLNTETTDSEGDGINCALQLTNDKLVRNNCVRRRYLALQLRLICSCLAVPLLWSLIPQPP